MRNQLLSRQFEALRPIGLDLVNHVVASATTYIEALEALEPGVPSPQIELDLKTLQENMDALEAGYEAAQQQIVALTAEVQLLQSELAEARTVVPS